MKSSPILLFPHSTIPNPLTIPNILSIMESKYLLIYEDFHKTWKGGKQGEKTL